MGRRPYISVATSSPRTLEAERGRITVTRTSSSAATEGCALSRGREVPPPVRHEVLAIYEEEDSQFEAPQGVSSNEEPPIEMTYRSMMSCSIEPAKSLPPNPMVELDKKKDIVVEKRSSIMLQISFVQCCHLEGQIKLGSHNLYI